MRPSRDKTAEMYLPRERAQVVQGASDPSVSHHPASRFAEQLRFSRQIRKANRYHVARYNLFRYCVAIRIFTQAYLFENGAICILAECFSNTPLFV